MKVYRVKVNGKVFEVELEAVSEVKGSVQSTPVSTPVTSSSSTGGATIVAPIAGKVLGVKVKVGDKVTKGQTVAVIEAMKLENEVPATAEGIVKEIKVNNGDSVNNNDVLIVLG
jgi:biotin carboxyl carrier protein